MHLPIHRLLASLPLGLLFVVAGCGDSAGPKTQTDVLTTEDVAIEDVGRDSSTTNADIVVGEVCIGSRNFCLNSRESALCNADGSAIAATTRCEGSSACEPLTGLCRDTLCAPDSQQCLDPRRVQTCAPDGSRWSDALACEAGLTCREGRCRACRENAAECLSDTSYRRCSEDATSWSGTLMCPLDHRCTGEGEDGSCKRCELEATCANDTRVRERCTSGLVTYDRTYLCGAGQTCVEGRCEACTANVTECLSETTYRQCADDGSRWGNAQPCEAGEACFETRCLPYACSPRVLFLVDYSGSMGGNWASVQQAVALIIAGNADVRFGLKSFPDVADSSCAVSGTLEIPFGKNLGATFDRWFENNRPSGGTPLAGGMAALETHADAIFGQLGGTVIVLTDGQDTCYSGTGATPLTAYLAETTAKLRLDHNIPTYAIGYAFGGDPSELNVIANNGGTGYTAHVPAGNEGELLDALGGIIDRVKFCELGTTNP